MKNQVMFDANIRYGYRKITLCRVCYHQRLAHYISLLILELPSSVVMLPILYTHTHTYFENWCTYLHRVVSLLNIWSDCISKQSDCV
jgi:hypothetical protein